MTDNANDILADLGQTRLIAVTGKGGIGKSTVAAALAQALSESGKRVCLIESSVVEQLAPLFGKDPIGHHETELAPGLTVINLDTDTCFREYISKYLGAGAVVERLFSHSVVQSFINTIPGIAELVLLGRIFYAATLSQSKKFDHVIYDGYAFGHFLSLMTSPRAVLDFGLVGPIVTESRRLNEFLSDPVLAKTLVVTTSDELVMQETREFLGRLRRESPCHVWGLVLNRGFVFQEGGQSAGRDRQNPPWEKWGGNGTPDAALRDYAIRLHQDLENGRKIARDLVRDFTAPPLALLMTPELGTIAEPIAAGWGRGFFHSGDAR